MYGQPAATLELISLPFFSHVNCNKHPGQLHNSLAIGVVCHGRGIMACLQHSTVDELSTAAVRGDIEEAKRILATGNVDVNARNHYGRTALQVMKASRADVAELLLKAGANPNIMDFSQHVNSHTRMTPAHDVARQGYLDTLRCLVRYGADITLQDAAGNTPAHLAAKYGHYHIVRYLSHGTDLHQHVNHAGLSPLNHSTSAKRKHLRRWLHRARTSPSSLCSIACGVVRAAMGMRRLALHRELPLPSRLQDLVALQLTPAGRSRHHTSSTSSSHKENHATASTTKRSAANRLSPLN